MRLLHFPVQTGHHRVSFHDSFQDPRPGGANSAIDIGSSAGTRIYAATKGWVPRRCVVGGETVPGAGNRRRSGNYVVMVDPDGYIYYYFHMRDRPAVRPGEEVPAGHLIGHMGNTGRGGPVHLHFQAWRPFAQSGAAEWYRTLQFPQRFSGAVNPYRQLEGLALRVPGARRGQSQVAGRSVAGVIIDPPGRSP